MSGITDKLKEVGTPHSSKKSQKSKKDKSLLENVSSDDESTSQKSVKMAPQKARKNLFRYFRKGISFTFLLFSKFPVVGKSKEKKEKADKGVESKKPKNKEDKKKLKDKDEDSKEAATYYNEADVVAPPKYPLFGVTLLEAWRNSCTHLPSTSDLPVHVPVILRVCIDYVQENGVQLEGIYRISTLKQRMEELRARADHGHELELDFQVRIVC